MKKTYSNFIIGLFLGILALIGGCKDVFEENISKEQVIINTPTDGAQSVIYKQLFWWNKLEGATQYSVQIATPSFDSMVSIVTDTVLIGVDKFYKTLSPGNYQWRIRAENGAYKTNYQTYKLTMLVSSLDQQTVNLTAPATNTYFGASSNGIVNFSWETVPGATKYVIEIDTISGNFNTGILLNETTTNSFYTYPFTNATQGDYKWRVKGQDDSGNETGWSSLYYTGYYASPPSIPVLASPANNSNVSTSATFTWNSVARAKTYTLYVYRNGADTMAVSSESYSVSAPTISKTVSLTSASSGDDIYWRVAATDKAGNVGTWSNRRTVNVE